MPSTVVIDSGPLIALFDKSDQHHRKAAAFVGGHKGVLVTNFAVVT